MSQGPVYPNLSQKVQKEVSQMANHNLSWVILLGGLSVNLNHLKTKMCFRTFWATLFSLFFLYPLMLTQAQATWWNFHSKVWVIMII